MSRTSTVISIVDDDLSVRRALRRLVKSAGYIVETFASAREFLESSPRGRSACLVLDIQNRDETVRLNVTIGGP
jgi:FixJ family two-component response regulator